MTKIQEKRIKKAIEHGCYLGDSGTMLDELGNEYRDENGECVVADLSDVAEISYDY